MNTNTAVSQGGGGYLTPRLEAMFWALENLLSSAAKGAEIGPLYIKDKVAELEAEVEEALAEACRGICQSCGGDLDMTPVNLCSDCFRNQQQKAQTTCHICKLLFVPVEPGQAICRACRDDEARAELHHREEVQRAHAATNGTL